MHKLWLINFLWAALSAENWQFMLHLRYLNQRFIEDIDDLMKGHEGMKDMFGGNTININQRFEQLEQNYSSLETTNINLTNSLSKLEQKFNSFVENHDTLQQNFTVLQSTNSSLSEKIRLLERNQEETRHELELTASELRKEMEEKANIQKSFQELQAAKSKVTILSGKQEKKCKIIIFFLSGGRGELFCNPPHHLCPAHPAGRGGNTERGPWKTDHCPGKQPCPN